MRTYQAPCRALAAVAVAVLPVAAVAQPVSMPTQVPDVFSVEVGGSVEHHSNIFALPNGPSDTLLRGLLGVRFTREVSLQRITAYAAVEPVKYLDFSRYDYVGYNAGLLWDWEVGRPVFGTVEARFDHIQTPFDVLGAPIDNLRDLFFLRGLAGFRITQAWSVIGAVDYLTTSNSNPTQFASDLDQTAFEAGTRYAPGTGLELDFVYRREQGEYPNRQVFDSNGNLLPAAVDNAYTQDGLLLRFGYRPTDVSRYGGSIGYIRRNFDTVPQRDFDGIVGTLDAEFPLTGQTLMRASLFRTISAEETLNANYVLVTGFALRPTWTVTSRFRVDGLFTYFVRNYEGDPGFVFTGEPVRKDNILDFGVRLNYEVARRVFLYSDLRRVQRNSNYERYDYTDTWFSLGVRAAF